MGRYLCMHCGYVGARSRRTRGSLLGELALWILLAGAAALTGLWLLPLVALGYSVYRLASKYWACAKCEAPGMIPEGSPVARNFLQSLKTPASVIESTIGRPPVA